MVKKETLLQKLLPSVSKTVKAQNSIKLGKFVGCNILDSTDRINTLKESNIPDTPHDNPNEVVQDIMQDLSKLEDFRKIQKLAYNAKEGLGEDSDEEVVPRSKRIKKSQEQLKEQAYFQFQKQYIEECKKNGALALPLLKKVKFDIFVLDNYQISTRIAKSFGKSMQKLGDHLKGVKLVNNNMKDEEMSDILEGMVHNPISILTIDSNKLAKKSVDALCRVLNISDATPSVKGKKLNTRIIELELNKCSVSKSLMRQLIDNLTSNRQLESLSLGHVDFDRQMVNNLGDFVVNNFNLKKLKISWSEFISEDLMIFMEKIKNIKHLQDLDVSTIPIEGPN
jgi:hypothetical protein